MLTMREGFSKFQGKCITKLKTAFLRLNPTNTLSKVPKNGGTYFRF